MRAEEIDSFQRSTTASEINMDEEITRLKSELKSCSNQIIALKKENKKLDGLAYMEGEPGREHTWQDEARSGYKMIDDLQIQRKLDKDYINFMHTKVEELQAQLKEKDKTISSHKLLELAHKNEVEHFQAQLTQYKEVVEKVKGDLEEGLTSDSLVLNEKVADALTELEKLNEVDK